MTEGSEHDITGLLHAWRDGDAGALEKLTPHVYLELHRAARHCIESEDSGHILQTTALINELYLRLVTMKNVDWQNRAHFFALCARQMRRILIDEARARRSQKRGSGLKAITLDAAAAVSPDCFEDFLAVDEALTNLARVDHRKAQVVELRYFGGLDVKETAEALTVSEETVVRDWRLAKAWLLRELRGERLDGS